MRRPSGAELEPKLELWASEQLELWASEQLEPSRERDNILDDGSGGRRNALHDSQRERFSSS